MSLGIGDLDLPADPHVGQSHGGDGLVAKLEAFRLGQAGGLASCMARAIASSASNRWPTRRPCRRASASFV